MKLFHSPEQSHESDERYTPQWVFDGLAITFDLDVAAPVEGGDCVPARHRYTRDDDGGLEQPWSGVVWCNPPFSNATAWADRFRQHNNGIFLGPVANSRWLTDLISATYDPNAVNGVVWLCRDFTFVALGPHGTRALTRLARTTNHPGNLVVVI